MAIFVKFIHDEGKAQGHDDTGAMLASIHYEVIEIFGAVIGTIKAENYSVYVQTGIKADRVNYPIKVMIDWWKRRGLDEEEATRAAWATRAKHKKEGIPTKASNAFSKTGKRINFVSDGIQKALLEAQALFEKELNAVIQFEINEYFKADLKPVFTIEI